MSKPRIHTYQSKIPLPTYLRDAWERKEVAWYMALRDIKVRYRETLLGWLWAVLQPLVTVVFLAFVFQTIAQIDTKGISPILFGISGYLIWGSFANNIAHSTHLLRNSRSMIRKVYFPRILLPSSAFLVNAIETGVSLLLLMLAAIYYDQLRIAHPIALLAILVGASVVSWGISTFLAGINLRYRDVNYIIPILLRMGLIITPIAFSVSSVPQEYQIYMYLNPATAYIELLRWALWDLGMTAYTLPFALGWLFFLPLIGVLYLNRLDRFIADVL